MGQRGIIVKLTEESSQIIRFRDPDGYIFEVETNIKSAAKRFADSGIDEEQIAVRMGVTVKAVKAFLR